MRGLTTALLRHSEEPVSDHLLPSGVPNLRLMPSGPLPPNPAELLGSQRMATLIEELIRQADVVVFDSPPLLAVVNGALLSHVCDATLLVALAGTTRAEALRDSKDRLVQSGARLLGTVFNQVSAAYGGYYKSYYTSETPPKQRIRWWRESARQARSSRQAALAESVARRAVVEGTLYQQIYRGLNGGNHTAAGTVALYTNMDQTPDQQFDYEHNGGNHSYEHNDNNHTAAGTVALYADMDQTPDQQFDYEHNGGNHSYEHNDNNHTAAGTVALYADMDQTPDQQFDYEHNGGNHLAVKSLALHAQGEEADQCLTESAGDQENLSNGELTVIESFRKFFNDQNEQARHPS